MNYIDYIIYLLAAVVICGILGGVIYFLAKKDRQNDEERVRTLTPQQKEILISTSYEQAVGLTNGVLVQGLIYEIPKTTNRKAELVVMFYNQYYPNFRGEIIHADVNVPIQEFQRYNLKAGDYVKLLLNEDKPAKVVF